MVVEDPQSLSDGSSSSERSWFPDRSLPEMSTTPIQNGLSSTSRDWLSFLFMTLGWFLFLSSIIGFWRVKRWEQTVTGPQQTAVTGAPTVEQIEEDHQLRHNLQRIFGIPFTHQPREDELSRVHQVDENPATPSALQIQNVRQARFARDLEAAGLV